MITETRTKTAMIDAVEAPTPELREQMAMAFLIPWMRRVQRECDMQGWKMGDVRIQPLVTSDGYRGINHTYVGLVDVVMNGDGYCNYCGESGADMPLIMKDNGQAICDLCKETQGE